MLPACRVVGAVEPGRRRGKGARPALGHNTTTPSSHCAAHAPWAVGRYSTGRNALEPHVAEFKRGDQNLSNAVPLICCGVHAVKPRPTPWGGARPALAQNITTPNPHCAAHMLRGRSALTPRDKKRTGRPSRDLNSVTTTSRSSCHQPTAVLMHPSPGRRRGDECAPSWATTQPRRARTTWRACFVGDRPILHGAKARGPHATGFQMQRPRTSEGYATDLSRC